MIKRMIINIMLLTILFFSACASTPSTPQGIRFSVLAPQNEFLSNKKFVIAPVSAVHKFVPSGDEDIDNYLISNKEIWQPGIAEYVRNRLPKKGAGAEIVQISAGEFKMALMNSLKLQGRDSFIDPYSGEFDEDLYEKILTGLAREYNANILVPRIALRLTQIENIKGDDALKVRWDGVKRNVPTVGMKFGRVYTDPFYKGNIDLDDYSSMDACSLHIDLFNKTGRVYWGNGGFDVKDMVSYGRMASGQPKEIERDMPELFGETNREYIDESILLAVKPIFTGKMKKENIVAKEEKKKIEVADVPAVTPSSQLPSPTKMETLPEAKLDKKTDAVTVEKEKDLETDKKGAAILQPPLPPVIPPAAKTEVMPEIKTERETGDIPIQETFSVKLYKIVVKPKSVPVGTYPKIKSYIYNTSSIKGKDGGKAIFDIKSVITYPDGKKRISWGNDKSFAADQKKVFTSGNRYDIKQAGTYKVEYAVYDSKRKQLLDSHTESFSVYKP